MTLKRLQIACLQKDTPQKEEQEPQAECKEEKKPATPAPEEFTCPRVPLCWVGGSEWSREDASLWHCCIWGSTLMKMAGPCGALNTASLKSSS